MCYEESWKLFFIVNHHFCNAGVINVKMEKETSAWKQWVTFGVGAINVRVERKKKGSYEQCN